MAFCGENVDQPRTCEKKPDRPEALVLAGSGASIPLFRELAARYGQLTGEAVSVPESIGTGGAIRALKDGAIDIGLATRPLKERERTAAIVETPFAITALGIAVREDTAFEQLDRDIAANIYSGNLRTWKDGSAIIPIQREQGDSGWQIISRADPELYQAILKGRELTYQRYCYTDGEVYATLEQVPGTVGIVDEGIVRVLGAPFRWAALPDIKRILFLIVKANRSNDVARFMEFLRSAEVSEYLLRHGYKPISREERAFFY